MRRLSAEGPSRDTPEIASLRLGCAHPCAQTVPQGALSHPHHSLSVSAADSHWSRPPTVLRRRSRNAESCDLPPPPASAATHCPPRGQLREKIRRGVPGGCVRRLSAEGPSRDRLRTGMCAAEPQGCDFRRVTQGALSRPHHGWHNAHRGGVTSLKPRRSDYFNAASSSRSFAFTTVALSRPMRISTFWPADSFSSRSSAY